MDLYIWSQIRKAVKLDELQTARGMNAVIGKILEKYVA